MNKDWLTRLKALRLEDWYYRRKAMMKPEGERNRLTVGIGIFFALAALGMLLMASWIPTDHQEYIEKQPNLFSLSDSDWYASELADFGCDLNLDCYERHLSFENFSLPKIDSQGNRSTASQFIVLSITVPNEYLQKLTKEPVVVVSLPLFRYERAVVYVEGRQVGRFFKNQRLVINLPQAEINADWPMDVTAVLEILPSDRTIAGTRDHGGVLVTDQSEFNQFEKYLHLKSSGAVGSMGAVAKVVLALFCVLLFLIVDSSPESLGLALFMGFEALALGIGRGWIPLGWIGFDHDMVLSNFCYQMGDLLKIYFFLQLARIGKPNPWYWLLIGTAVSIPYGYFMEYAYENSFTWQYKIPRTRDTIAGAIGFVVCAQSFYSIRRESLPWRKSALTIGMMAALVEVSKSWVAHSDISSVYPLVNTIYGMLEANLGYLFALSTFLNISTLENRVRTLTEEKEKANEIKRQMELGQSLQKAFLTLPKLPDSVSLTCYHEAAVYVSGDTYFVHWDQGTNRLAFLLNDVTGFGVQAALKAFAGNVIARTIWVDTAEDIRRKADRRRQETNLEKYDLLVDQLLCRNASESTDDFNAMIGAEFDLNTGELALYRANYNFPFIITPEFAWHEYEEGEINLWNCEKVQLKNRSVLNLKLKPGSFIIFISDGYIENSRAELAFLRSLKQHIAATRKRMTAAMVQSLALDWAKENGMDKHHDDRTVMVFQWVPEAQAQILAVPESDSKSA